MFAIFGLLLTGYGVRTAGSEIYAASLGMNINLWWGLVLLLFGGTMLALGRRGTSTMRSSAESPEGRATEAREKRTGLER
jgi:hypothetical protein